MTFYTQIQPVGAERVIVLNRNYTKEQVRQRLTFTEGGPSSEEIQKILDEGIYLPENQPKIVNCKYGGYVSTESRTHSYSVFGKVIVYPDGSFQQLYPSFWEKMMDTLKEMLLK